MRLSWQPVSPGDGPAILTSVTGAESAELARLAAGRQVLEVGSAYGYSAVVMARAGADVTAVDDHHGGTWLGDTLPVMQSNLAAYGVAGRVEIMRGASQRVLPALGGEEARFGLVFVDGDHSAETVRHDVLWALRLLAPGGVLACHDYGEETCPGVAVALDQVFPAGPSRLTDTLFVVEDAAA